MQCIILAGGIGHRMMPLTTNIPKILLDIDGKPFIYHQLKLLANNGITDVLFCIGHLGYMIKEYKESFGMNINYSDEGEDLLGTAGSLKLAIDKLDDKFLVMYGDSYLPIDYKSVYQNNKPTMTIYNNKNKYDKSNVLIKNNGNILYDKSYSIRPKEDFSYIDYGLSLLTKEAISNIAVKKYKLEQLYHQLSLNDNLQGYEVYNRFFEIGSISGLEEFKTYVKSNNT
jgi:N-acetyl-alpha-D-muramate 1-phosphate uridylyltransferase